MTKFPDPPKTFRDRIAWALAAHDIQGCEGRMTDEELQSLDRVLLGIARTYGSRKAEDQFLGGGGAACISRLRGFANLEHGFRDAKGKARMHAHLIALDWPTYRGAADAVLSVLLESPESVSLMLKDAAE